MRSSSIFARSAWTVGILASVAFVFAASGFCGDNWPSWRGAADDAGSGGNPVKWDANNGLAWKTPLPGKGCSTPVVWGKRIYLTAPLDGEDAVLAFDWSGKPLWQTVIGKAELFWDAGSSPVLTEKDVVVAVLHHGDSYLAAFDKFTGELRWKVARNYKTPSEGDGRIS